MGVKVYDIKNLEHIHCRTGSDGYQAKYYANDRKYFIKTQAKLSGVLMNDWQVEIIASKICDKLNINCVKQSHCRVKDSVKTLDAVISDNFELSGNEFVSFETLLNRLNGKSTSDSEFIKLNTSNKLRYCASIISKACNIDIKYSMKYMIDLAVIDILVGNIDRHTRNFGVFWNNKLNCYTIAKIFDNGMGLFENDDYRDRYKNINERLRTLYVSPYGEDPFDMIEILYNLVNLNSMYNFKSLKVSDYTFPNSDSKLYFSEILTKIRRQ